MSLITSLIAESKTAFTFCKIFTIIFFAKEEENCTMVPQFPEAFKPTQVPFQKDEVYPFVISAETAISPSSGSEEPLVHKQITLACLEKTDDGSFNVKVMKQILWIEGARYELHELYGIDNSTAQDDDVASGDCAKELRFQSNKCPICRQPIDELLMIKVETSNEQH
ncbi:hypothetical protein Bca52824_056043 [Brassica carinata]|uniref:RING-type E3 ubiquitin transferase n=1 Tax=Brassica carinata TaxID=52824 RepID=A0A8X7QNH3_BRACI|nr:hypothetical protein Bca52824_056043 [Brassica carinata]